MVQGVEISKSEREEMSLFFETLIRLDGFGYTIFGQKPVSSAGCWVNQPVPDAFFDKEAVYRRGQKLWEKYTPSKNFVLKFEEKGGWYGIIIINKPAFIHVVTEQQDEFRRILGPDITPENLLSQLIDPANSFEQIVKHDDGLLGILFGYGHKNAQMFKRKKQLLSSEGKEKIEAEYNFLNERLKPTAQESILDLFPDVGFLADLESEETQKILKEYDKSKCEIMKAILSDNLLGVILCKLADGLEQDPDCFFSAVAKKENIQELVPHRLYCEVLQSGSSSLASSNLFHYKITTLDATVVADTYAEGAPKSVCLENALPGFARGVAGMKAGEKRRLYIHPDLAYRKIGVFLPPQSLITVEVEAL